MAKTRGVRPRIRAIVFGAYVLVVVGVAFLISAPLSIYVDPGATRWICAAYVLLAATILAGVCAGAVARSGRLDMRLAELETEAGWTAPAAPADDPPSPLGESIPADGPTDRDVDQLLEELERVGASAAATLPGEESEALARQAADAAANLRAARSREVRRLTRVRAAVGACAAGPAIASIALLGVFTPLLPASDGMLLGSLQLNAFMGIAGLGWLAGLAVYAGLSFHGLS